MAEQMMNNGIYTPKPLLSAEHISKSFGSTRVLEDISFSLQKGGVLSIIGSSGSGKTTLLRCLNFLETPDAGIVRVGGRVVFDASEKAKLSDQEIRRRRLHFGMVFQSFNLFPQYTALENVVLPMQLMARERKDWAENKNEILAGIRERAGELLKKMGLKDRMTNYPHELSGGQCQRVAIARALALEPDILCFDEPTSALDPELTGEVLRVMQELAAQNTTMVIVTHEMAFARDVSTEVLFMDGGRVLESGSPADVFDNPKMERTKQFLARYKNG